MNVKLYAVNGAYVGMGEVADVHTWPRVVELPFDLLPNCTESRIFALRPGTLACYDELVRPFSRISALTRENGIRVDRAVVDSPASEDNTVWRGE